MDTLFVIGLIVVGFGILFALANTPKGKEWME